MKDVPIYKSVERSIEATTLISDLRGFTPNLNASREGEDGINSFLPFPLKLLCGLSRLVPDSIATVYEGHSSFLL
jgi:hypothetical protein